MNRIGAFILDNAGWPALLVDNNGTVRSANGAAVAMFGGILEGDSALLNSIWAPNNETTSEQFLVKLARSTGLSVPIHLKIKGGLVARHYCYICPCILDAQKLWVFQIFEEKLAESQASAKPPTAAPHVLSMDTGLAHKQKLDCALQLIRSVVLDFNNALTSILAHSTFILAKAEIDHPWRNSLLEIEKSGEKAAEIAHDLASFSRQEKDTKTLPIGNLNDLLRRTVEIFQAPDMPAPVWNLDLETQLYEVQFDEAKIQQAFLKILDNAVQSLGGDARITIRSRNLDLGDSFRDGTVTISPGNYVYVEISDNGCGIPPEILPRIFEPFFTTKQNHRGLGLAWVYGIVTNHGGSVAVSSQQALGTDVRIYFPAQKRFVKHHALRPDDLGGNQTILMVDDEVLMLNMGQMVLSSFGYKVMTANSGEKALEIMSQPGVKIDLVITDMVMPKMSGRELMERLRHQSPELRVLWSSGYVRPANKEERDQYLQKPFTSQELLRKVRESLS
jgi:nitrogen-specific signal transduction histidine kinase/CheY-like chemotaxis protein